MSEGTSQPKGGVRREGIARARGKREQVERGRLPGAVPGQLKGGEPCCALGEARGREKRLGGKSEEEWGSPARQGGERPAAGRRRRGPSRREQKELRAAAAPKCAASSAQQQLVQGFGGACVGGKHEARGRRLPA